MAGRRQDRPEHSEVRAERVSTRELYGVMARSPDEHRGGALSKLQQLGRGQMQAVGPGAFIGVRVGIATMKGLAMGTDRPVVPVSTLEALAIRALEPDALGEVPADARPRLTICPLIDARRREVYAACYRPDLERGVVLREGEEMLISPTSLVERLTGPMFFLGDGVGLHRAAIVKQLGSRAFFPPSDRPDLMEPSAVAVGRLAGRRWTEGGAVDPGELTAVYFRPAVEQIASPR